MAFLLEQNIEFASKLFLSFQYREAVGNVINFHRIDFLRISILGGNVGLLKMRLIFLFTFKFPREITCFRRFSNVASFLLDLHVLFIVTCRAMKLRVSLSFTFVVCPSFISFVWCDIHMTNETKILTLLLCIFGSSLYHP